MEFQIGDRVAVDNSEDYPELNGRQGVIRGSFVTDAGKTICNVEFDRPLDELSDGYFNGHTCGGLAAAGHGWNIKETELVLVFCDVEIDITSLI